MKIRDVGKSFKAVKVGVFKQLERWQRKTAGNLQHATDKISVKRKKYGLVIIVTGASLMLLLQVGMSLQKESTIKQDAIIVPKIPKNGLRNIDYRLYRDICQFETLLDSLQHTPEGKKEINKLVKERPGLLDSVFIAKKIYERKIKSNEKRSK